MGAVTVAEDSQNGTKNGVEDAPWANAPWNAFDKFFGLPQLLQKHTDDIDLEKLPFFSKQEMEKLWSADSTALMDEEFLGYLQRVSEAWTSDPEAPESFKMLLNPVIMDRLAHAVLGRMTMGISPGSVMQAYSDWLTHLAISPGKQLELANKLLRKILRLRVYMMRAAVDPAAEPCIEPLKDDHRFMAPEWRKWPFNIVEQGFLLTQQWWHNAATDVKGVQKHHLDVVKFSQRQMLDMLSPSNYFWTNPEILKRTLEEGGRNLYRGALNYFEDIERSLSNSGPELSKEYVPGKAVAATPGKVVYRNRLIELIQYSPTTETVHPEPILIVPAWIMKYYILDLSPHNSLIKYLVDKGHTVFVISWRNPTFQDRDLDMKDYLEMGVMDALDTISGIIPEQKIHTAGYCLGGTLLSIAACTMARDGDDRLASMTLLAAQTDFREAGELTLFIDDSQVDLLEDMMWNQKYLETSQMAGTFQLLRSNDLIWSQGVRKYMMGEKDVANDLMAWNADQTRLPYRMHKEYLRSMFLNNDLAEGRYQVHGRSIALQDLTVPVFAVGTVKDHVAPWKSVYKLHLSLNTHLTFVLTSGGHNAGIVSEPGHRHRSYQIGEHQDGDHYLPPEDWAATTEKQEGSWWEAWQSWLSKHSGKKGDLPKMGLPPRKGKIIGDAPGEYVFQR